MQISLPILTAPPVTSMTAASMGMGRVSLLLRVVLDDPKGVDEND